MRSRHPRRVTKLVEYPPDVQEYGDTVPGNPNDLEFGPRQRIRISLDQVNLIRQALAIGEGKLPKLPPGSPGDPKMCVIANALSNGWEAIVGPDELNLRHPTEGIDWEAIKDTLEAYEFQVSLSHPGRKNRPLKSRTIVIRTPAAMAQLINLFDEGKLPSLLDAKGRKMLRDGEL